MELVENDENLVFKNLKYFLVYHNKNPGNCNWILDNVTSRFFKFFSREVALLTLCYFIARMLKKLFIIIKYLFFKSVFKNEFAKIIKDLLVIKILFFK